VVIAKSKSQRNKIARTHSTQHPHSIIFYTFVDTLNILKL